MDHPRLLKILLMLIICIFLVILYQILLTTPLFNHVESTLSKSTQDIGTGNVNVYLEKEETFTLGNVVDDEPLTGINIIITFTNAKQNSNLQSKFRTTVASIFKWASTLLNIYIIGDSDSQFLAETILRETANTYRKEYKVIQLETKDLAKRLYEVIKDMQKFFSDKPGAYYSESLFFLSIAIHRVMPETLHKVIMLDADLKFDNDVTELFKLFNKFSSKNIIGIARENQPVYRHVLATYRQLHKNTHIGGPPPDGISGFNSGVLLLNLDKIRRSDVYNSLINPDILKNLTEKYFFKGHLGDQDFFSLVSFEHPELFYILPCTWNRQLCTWWRDKGYESVFDLYFKCEGHINVYHGNCNSEIPKLEWEK